jgi:hypothetical protein
VGIILFSLVAKAPPFVRADPENDHYFKLIYENRLDIFWKAHAKSKFIQMGGNPKETPIIKCDDYFSPDF